MIPFGRSKLCIMQEKIEVGYQAFVSYGGEAFGAIREVSPSGLVVDVENAGDSLFFVSLDAVEAVHFQKVIFKSSKLDPRLREAIRHACLRRVSGMMGVCENPLISIVFYR